MKEKIKNLVKTKPQKILVLSTAFSLLVAVTLFSYAFFSINYEGLNTNKISTCTFDISFKDSNPIRLLTGYPMTYNETLEYEPYTFYIKSNASNCDKISYRLSMKSICDSCTQTNGLCSIDGATSCNCNSSYQLSSSKIAYYLKNTRTNEEIQGVGLANLNKVFTLNSVMTDTYEMKMWIDSSAIETDLYVYDTNGNVITNTDGTYETKNYCGKLNVDAYISANQDTSGANAPELATGMIPVYYDSANDTWRKADSSNYNATHQWYSYTDKMWANAVTVTETNRTTYQSAAVGAAISMDDINTMWVWIPRFNAVTPSNYNGGTQTAPGAIDVTFVNNTTTALDAFTFGEQTLSGFWYGKFEISHTTLASSTTVNNLGCSNETCSNANGLIIKPNVISLRYNNVSNFFYASRSMEQTGNAFGFNNTIDTTLDTHMSKNNEWGAVAYLTQSIYGRCTSSTSCTEVTINNCSTFTTGIGADTVSANSSSATCTTAINKYNGAKGVLASTTGTIYGIYDMSGGAWEYVMGNYNNTTSSSGLASTWFTSNSKYYNLYTGTTFTGHALTETSGWYSDYANFVNSNYPWFGRGGYCNFNSVAGLFDFTYSTGDSYFSISLRPAVVK